VRAIDEALRRLARESLPCAELVKLRLFAGLTLDEAAVSLGLARRTADRYWAYARARLYEMLSGGSGPSETDS
jgi:DNA-directed RNA polymerase specialized sigma24 family protein